MGFYSSTSYSRNIVSIIGSFMVHFVIGTIYTTGNLSIYIASYLRSKGSSVTMGELSVLFPLQITAATCSVFIGTMITNRTSKWITVSLGNSLVVLSVFITSFLQDPISVIFIFGLVYGMGAGISVISNQYSTPLMISWSHFPEHKGRVTGIIISGFGFGTTLFNLVATFIINPDNKKASDKHDGVKYFSRDVSENLPTALRILALCYLLISLVGILLLGKIIKVDGKLSTLASPPTMNDECPDLKTGLKHRNFSILFLLGFLANTPGLYVAAAYKTFGVKEINNDDFLALTGSVASIFNGAFRYIWPQLMDKSTFKRILMILLCIQLPLVGTLYFIAGIKPLFFLWVCGIYGCEGGLATLFPSVIVKCFGKVTGAKVYGIYYYSVALSAILGYLIQLFIVEYFGYLSLFMIMAGLTVASIVILQLFFVEINPWTVQNKFSLQQKLNN